MPELPHDDDAERVVLGCLMTDPAAVEPATERLSTGAFYRPAHQTIYAHIVAAWAAGQPTEPVALLARMTGDELRRTGGAGYLHDCVAAVPTAAQADHYLSLVERAAWRRQVAETAARLAHAAADGDDQQLAELVTTAAGLPTHPVGQFAGRGRRLVLTPASQIAPQPVTWAWEDAGAGRIPAGALSIAAGREGTGKSSMGIWLAAQITQGTLPGAWYGRPRSVVYVAVEDSWAHTLVPRLIASEADLTRVLRAEVAVDAGQETTLCLPADLALLESTIAEHDVAAVVLDPLMSTIGAGIDTHRERDTRTALDPLARLADRTGTVIFGIAHFNKATGPDPSALITGSGAFKNVPRAIFGFAVDPSTGEAVMSQTKNSLGRADLPSLAYRILEAKVDTDTGMASVGRFVLDGPAACTVADILAGGIDGEDQADAAAWLRSYLTDNGGEAEARDVFTAGERNGFSKDALKRAKRRAQVTSRKEGMDAGWMWALPEARPEPDP